MSVKDQIQYFNLDVEVVNFQLCFAAHFLGLHTETYRGTLSCKGMFSALHNKEFVLERNFLKTDFIMNDDDVFFLFSEDIEETEYKTIDGDFLKFKSLGGLIMYFHIASVFGSPSLN